MQTWRMVLAMLDREIARLDRRADMIEKERDKLTSQPVSAQDGDDSSAVEQAKQLDRLEYELDLATAELRAVKAFGHQLQEQLGTDPDERPERADLIAAKRGL
jgi:hypothetical protein